MSSVDALLSRMGKIGGKRKRPKSRDRSVTAASQAKRLRQEIATGSQSFGVTVDAALSMMPTTLTNLILDYARAQSIFWPSFSASHHIKIWRLCLDDSLTRTSANDGDTGTLSSAGKAQCVDTYSLIRHRDIMDWTNVALSRCVALGPVRRFRDRSERLYLLVFHQILLRFDTDSQRLTRVGHSGLPRDCLTARDDGRICAVAEATYGTEATDCTDGTNTDAIYFCGGWSADRQSDELFPRNLPCNDLWRLEDSRWSRCPDMPWAVNDHGMVGHHGVLIVTGGNVGRRYASFDTDACAAFMPDTSKTDRRGGEDGRVDGRWFRLPSLNRGRSEHLMTVLDGKVVVIGGRHKDRLNSCLASTIEALDLQERHVEILRARSSFNPRSADEEIGAWKVIAHALVPYNGLSWRETDAWRSIHHLTASSAIITSASEVDRRFYNRLQDAPGLPGCIARLDTSVAPSTDPPSADGNYGCKCSHLYVAPRPKI